MVSNTSNLIFLSAAMSTMASAISQLSLQQGSLRGLRLLKHKVYSVSKPEFRMSEYLSHASLCFYGIMSIKLAEISTGYF
jgi:hypothetical protein